MIVMETACLQTIDLFYCGGYVPLFVTMCHGLSIFILPWIDIVVFYQFILYQLSWILSSWIIMTVLVILPVEWSVFTEDHYQLYLPS
jgi:tetrahydromethanopterin S-methyltransferase subunit E